jgi:hypothetical protein
MPTPDVKVRIRATNETGPAFQGLENVLNRVRSQVVGLASILSVRAIGGFLGSTIKESADAESALSELRAAVTNAGGDFGALQGQTDAAAQGVQRLSRYSDDAARGALAKLITVSGNVQGSLTNLQVVVDLAATRHIELSEAADVVGKAMAGNTTQLGRLYPQLKTSTNAVGDLAKMLSGRAAADAETFAGSLQQAKNALKDVEEATGDLITQNPLLRGAMHSAAIGIKEIAENHSAAAGAVVLATTAAIGLTVALPGLALAITTVKWALTGLTLAAGPVAVVIGLISVAVGAYALTAGKAAEQTAKLAGEIAKLEKPEQVLDRMTALSEELARTPAKLSGNGAPGIGFIEVDNPRRKALEEELRLLGERYNQLVRIAGVTTRADGNELETLKKLAALHRLDADGIERLRQMRVQLNAEIASGTLKGQAYLDKLQELKTVEDLLAQVTKEGVDRRKEELDQLAELAGKTELTAGQVNRLRQRYEEATRALEQKNLSDKDQNRLLDEQRQAIEALQKVGAQTSATFTTGGSTFGQGPTFGLPTIPKPAAPGEDPFKGVRFGPDAVDDTGGFFGGGDLLKGFDEQMRAAATRAVQTVDAAEAEVLTRLQEMNKELMEGIHQEINFGLADTLAGALEAGVEAAFQGKDFFAAAGKAILAGLGSIFTRMGAELIAYGIIMLHLLPFLSNPFTSGPAAIAAGAALVAVGSALGAIAHGRGGSGSSGSFSGSGSTEDKVTQITIQAPAVTQASQLTPQKPIIYSPVFIGKDDQQAQRQLVEMLNLAAGRGHKIKT